MCIHCLDHFPPTFPPISGQNLFCPLVL
jgi:hypothetical protein